MPSYNAENAECFVYTYKEGVLSAVAHDLQLKVSDWVMTTDPDAGTVTARFDPTSLLVMGAIKDGELAPSALSGGDRETIRGNIQKDVLHTGKYPEIRFRSTRVDGLQVEGELTLHGVTKPVKATLQEAGDHYTTEIRLHQPDFGIKPYSAMLGTLKVKPDVRVVLRVPKS